MSIVLEHAQHVIVFAGDASYTEQNMVDGITDGVSASMGAARDSLARLRRLAVARPTVYLPTHDPGSGARLAAYQTVSPS
jgi:glyoxylase-like metal-dependent hydrolase (beta-lactamase superfamily II)